MPSLLVVCSKFGVFPLLVISLSLALGWFASPCFFLLLLLQFERVSFAVCVCCVGYYFLSHLVLWFLM
jgi:hypothetical protein